MQVLDSKLNALSAVIHAYCQMARLDAYAALCVTFGWKTSVDPPQRYETLDTAVADQTELFREFLEDAMIDVPEMVSLLTRQAVFIVGPRGLERVLRWETPDTMLICQPTGATLDVLASVTA